MGAALTGAIDMETRARAAIIDDFIAFLLFLLSGPERPIPHGG
jgi:hypothetical protein